MTLAELKLAVKNHLSDSSFDDRLEEFINEALFEAVEEVYPGIPELQEAEPITLKSGTHKVPLPSNSSGKVRSLFDASGYPLEREESIEDLVKKFGGLSTSGDPSHFASDRAHLYYQPVPSADISHTIIHYKLPSLLQGDTEEPSIIPLHLQRTVIVYGAVAIAFREIEQDTENEALATVRYERDFINAKSKLGDWVQARLPLRENYRYGI